MRNFTVEQLYEMKTAGFRRSNRELIIALVNDAIMAYRHNANNPEIQKAVMAGQLSVLHRFRENMLPPAFTRSAETEGFQFVIDVAIQYIKDIDDETKYLKVFPEPPECDVLGDKCEPSPACNPESCEFRTDRMQEIIDSLPPELGPLTELIKQHDPTAFQGTPAEFFDRVAKKVANNDVVGLMEEVIYAPIDQAILLLPPEQRKKFEERRKGNAEEEG